VLLTIFFPAKVLVKALFTSYGGSEFSASTFIVSWKRARCLGADFTMPCSNKQVQYIFTIYSAAKLPGIIKNVDKGIRAVVGGA
jgi:hypothetical protein